MDPEAYGKTDTLIYPNFLLPGKMGPKETKGAPYTLTEEQAQLLQAAKAARRKPVLKPGEVAVRVAPSVMRRRNVTDKEAPVYLKWKTSAWPLDALTLQAFEGKWQGKFWIVLNPKKGGSTQRCGS